MLIDSHCHLYLGSWADNLRLILQDAESNGVGKIISPGIDLDTSQKCIEIAEIYDDIYAAAGIHPHDAKDAQSDYLDSLRKMLKQPKVVAVGEIGLDFYRNISDADIQFKIFREQLKLAQDSDLPVIIHNRNSDKDIIETLKDFKSVRGVAHCFSSDLATAEKFLEMGFYISFAGNLTYKNSDLPDVAKEIPLYRLLVETDAPYLSPMPFCGKENQPGRVKYVAEKLAECKGIDFDEIEEVTQNNTETLFNLPKN